MKLIIVFTKIESHSDFNGEGTIEVGEYLHYRDLESRKRIGFHLRANHFCRISPDLKVLDNTFSKEKSNLKGIEVTSTDIILIQLKENLNDWSDEFRNDFIEYASKFDQVYISYHKGPNDGEDIRNGNHRLLEGFLKDKEVITTEKHQHIDNENQLYAVLARAIVKSKGNFTKESYDDLVEKMVDFFPKDEEINEANERKAKLKLLYNLLGTNISNETRKSYQNLKTQYEELPNLPSAIDGDFVRAVRDIILEKVI